MKRVLLIFESIVFLFVSNLLLHKYSLNRTTMPSILDYIILSIIVISLVINLIIGLYPSSKDDEKTSSIVLVVTCFAIFGYVAQISFFEYGSLCKKSKKEVAIKPIIIDTMTVYNAEHSQCDSEPLITASNDTIDVCNFPVNWIALSRDIMQKHDINYGDTIIVDASDSSMSGVFIVKDTMHKRKKMCADMLCKNRKLGLCTNVKIYKY